jgi:DNA-directed RNA polymerase II subunit RPB3
MVAAGGRESYTETEHFGAFREEYEAPLDGAPQVQVQKQPQPKQPQSRVGVRLRFEAVDVPVSVVNGLRRAIMADVHTAAFPTDNVGVPPGPEVPGVWIHKNSAVLHNEFMGQRLGLVPINLDARQLAAFATRKYKFVIRKKNKGTVVQTVTSADIQVFYETDAALSPAERDLLFPPSPVTGDYVLLTPLKPSAYNDADGEELHVECRARLGTGREHARWNPTSECFFRNKIDDAAFAASLRRVLGALPPDASPETRKRAEHDHRVLDGQRAFVTDAHGAASAFEFTVKSESRLHPKDIVLAGLRALGFMLDALLRGLRAEQRHTQGEDEPPPSDGGRAGQLPPLVVTIHAPLSSAAANADSNDFHRVSMRPADHTLGNLVQDLLYVHWIRDGGSREVSYVGYHMPHPNEDVIDLTLKCTAQGADVRQHLLAGVAWALRQVDALRDEWAAATGAVRY